MSAHPWPPTTAFVLTTLNPDPACPVCNTPHLTICDHRHRFLLSLNQPLHLVCKLAHCPNLACPTFGHTISPSSEILIAPPRVIIAWDTIAWIGQRRFARDWSVPQIRMELHDTYRIDLSADAIERHILRYQTILAARELDPNRLKEAYRDAHGLLLSIDGLQPEKGNETLYVVRELSKQRVWFAEPLLSSAAAEVARLLERARDMVAMLGLPVHAWISDKQAAFVSGIRTLFPGVPHRYCANHFLRDAAKPVLEMDSHAKVAMRRKVRGLRDIERQLLTKLESSVPPPPSPKSISPEPAAEHHADASPLPPVACHGLDSPSPVATAAASAAQVVLDYCAVTRGILNDDQGGPLRPPALRMSEALMEVRASLARLSQATSQGLDQHTLEHHALARLAACIDRGIDLVAPDLAVVRGHVDLLAKVAACLDPATKTAALRKADFDELASALRQDENPIRLHIAAVMTSFSPGLFAGGDNPNLPVDNLDLERAFKHPKRHRRRIHGRAHAGSQLVHDGPTLLLALDAHQRHPDVFAAEDLIPYRAAGPPPCQCDARRRRTLMRKARSKKKRASLLAILESQYLRAVAYAD